MYRHHRIELITCWTIVSIIAFIYNWDFFEMAGTAITIASIAIGVYIAAVSALLGSKYAEKLQQIEDPEIKTKTFLGVLAHYFRYAGTGCMFLIIISIIYCIPTEPIMLLSLCFNGLTMICLHDARLLCIMTQNIKKRAQSTPPSKSCTLSHGHYNHVYGIRVLPEKQE